MQTTGGPMTTSDQLARVFMVEDNPDDIFLTDMLMRRNRVRIDFTYFRDGEECVNYLGDKAKALNGGRPDLVLLDLNLPRIDGREVLKFIKQDPDLQSIPVVMLSGSSAPNDIEQTRKLGATTYLIKPLNLESLQTITRHVDSLDLVDEGATRYFIRVKRG
jgi:CheY-like chemotaxis protein